MTRKLMLASIILAVFAGGLSAQEEKINNYITEATLTPTQYLPGNIVTEVNVEAKAVVELWSIDDWFAHQDNAKLFIADGAAVGETEAFGGDNDVGVYFLDGSKAVNLIVFPGNPMGTINWVPIWVERNIGYWNEINETAFSGVLLVPMEVSATLSDYATLSNQDETFDSWIQVNYQNSSDVDKVILVYVWNFRTQSWSRYNGPNGYVAKSNTSGIRSTRVTRLGKDFIVNGSMAIHVSILCPNTQAPSIPPFISSSVSIE